MSVWKTASRGATNIIRTYYRDVTNKRKPEMDGAGLMLLTLPNVIEDFDDSATRVFGRCGSVPDVTLDFYA